MTGYKRARLGQLNRLVALKNKFSSHKGRQNLVVGSKFINGINVSKKLESLLGQSTCTSYPDSRIKSILCSVDLIKNDYLRNELHRKEPCETLNSEIYSYIPKGQKVPSDMSSLSRPQSVSIHLPLLVKQDKFYNVVTDDDNHPKLILIFAIAFVFAVCLLFYWPVDYSSCKKSFNGFNVLITGGSSGIGLSLAKLFYTAGANVTIVARDLEKLKSAREIITCGRNGDNNVFILSVDLASDYNILNEVLSNYMTNFGYVDIVVNCAGYAIARKFLDTPTNDIERMLRLNYLSAVYVTRILLPFMLDQKVHQTHERRIAFVCSLASQVGVYGYTAYTGSKYALRGFAETLEMELGYKGPIITIAFPPDTDTPGYTLENIGKPAATKAISATAGLASPDDVAKSIYLDIINGKLISTYGLKGAFLSWLTAGIFPPVSVRFRYRADYLQGIIGAFAEILAATPLRAVGIVYAFWMRYISSKYNE
ncbi:3-ketodihydrosphingosine reductase [Schistosoma japonicum]|uniref:3-dehydrosphinganine reductase n=1 Tax=Schistosoma japonicum TaxID=6182 RepID=A0A4Z2DVQ7_SCHJA|nr:3-ketodihydrosphingosine reductase [Schistosoma japonicum]